MKELTVEQKAKAYDEALQRTRRWYDSNTNEGYRAIFEEIFPEIKEESEGERIRKALIKYYSFDKDGGSHALDNITPKQILIWLEKQGEQKPVIEMKTPEESLGIDSDTYNKIVDECIYGEQKPAWSEEDKRNLDWLITVCERIHYKSDPQVSPKGALVLKDWLKSLKDRSIPQPKQEWSEDDIKEFKAELQSLMFEWSNKKDNMGVCIDRHIDKLLSILCNHTQSQWKPSEEQMEAMYAAVNLIVLRDTLHPDNIKALDSLYNDLKAL